MNSSLAIVPDPAPVSEPPPAMTLLEVVSEIAATGASDREVVAAVFDLLERGRVRLIGQICEVDLLTH